jgi:hypothetical protein
MTSLKPYDDNNDYMVIITGLLEKRQKLDRTRGLLDSRLALT